MPKKITVSRPPLYSNIAATLNFDRLSELSDIKPGSSEGFLFKDTKKINLDSSGKKKKKHIHKLSFNEQQTPKQKSIEKFYSTSTIRATNTPVPIMLPKKKSKKNLKKSSKMVSVSEYPIDRTQPTIKEILAMDQGEPAWIKNPMRFLNDKARYVYEMKTI